MNPPIERDHALIARVSRSFALSLRALPRPVRDPICLGYLLARATDTLADAAGLPIPDRIAALDAFAGRIAGESAADPIPFAMRAAAATAHPGERALLERAAELFARLDLAAHADREDLRRVLAEIVRGQRLDLARTSAGNGRFQLASAADLLGYADLVAGSVGEFWTSVCLRRMPGCARAGAADLIPLGRRFGQGLQLVNILRDFPRDVAAGRCYLPADALAHAGIDPAAVFQNAALARPVFEKWCATADEFLGAGRSYADALRSPRLRFATALPCLLGERTIAALRHNFPQPSVKVPRGEVRRLALATFVRCLLGRPLPERGDGS